MTDENKKGYTATELWRATRNALIKTSLRWNTGSTLFPSVCIRYKWKPATRFEALRVGQLNRHKGRTALINNVTIGCLNIRTEFQIPVGPLCGTQEIECAPEMLVYRTVSAIVWFLTADGHMSCERMEDIIEKATNSLDSERVCATTVESLSDLTDPKVVSSAYHKMTHC